MGIFDFWKSSNGNGNGTGTSVVPETVETVKSEPPTVDKKTFIQDEENYENQMPRTGGHIGIEGLMSYLEQMNYEGLGHKDAVICSDPHYKSKRVEQFIVEFKVKIDCSIAYYQRTLKDLESKAKKCEEHGLMQEANNHKKRIESVQDQIKLHQAYLNDLEDKKGIFERISLPYENGFARGVLAANRSKITATN